ncbi:MAG: RdgB/HAM1 family non-canonical purine NTP pyrophosphatase [Candidatus Nanopelagicaceae bacterium]|nr:RdgB/HAM1 family non-canonical purine NTP pyrophosphatase [Candidatus Nanopelagicaceae bacterium]
MPAQQIVLATRNVGKIAEFRRILDEIHLDSIELVGLEHFPELEDVDETGQTFLENALLKARIVCAQTGLPAIADDSGLCIDALDGSPGIFSARWSGIHGNDQANIEKVLMQLDSVKVRDRGAHFTCVSAFVMPDGSETTAQGILEGHILAAPIGDSGFGYDPIFRPLGSTLSLAQLDAREKDQMSHRGQSLRAIAPRVAVMLGTLG